MNKGFTLIETLVSLALLLLAVLSSSRILVAALAHTRGSAARFRLVETLEFYKNVLSSLPFAAPELTAGTHNRREGDLRVDWRVEDRDPFLKRVRLTAAGPRYALPLVMFRSRFILEARP